MILLRHKLLENSLKQSTVRNYQGQIRQYLRFMGPAPMFELWSDESAALWVFHDMEVRGLSKNTLKGRIAAFVYGVYKYTGRKCKTNKEERYAVLGMLHAAIERKADDVQRKLAVGKLGLARCYNSVLQKYNPEGMIQLWAWWIVSYGAMLRCSECSRIQWKDVDFSTERLAGGVPKSMRITIRALEDDTFKTHQCAVEFRFMAVTGAGVCPVKALWAWQQMTIRTYGYLGQEVFSFSVDNVRKAFQAVAAESLGGTPREYGLHSLRAGAATDAEDQGWAISEIMFMGRWRSPTVLVYLRQGDRWLHELGLPARSGTTVRPTMFRGCKRN
jgi:integrase